MQREAPSLLQVIAALPSLDELAGAEDHIRREGLMTDEVRGAIATRRAELQRRMRQAR